MFWNWIKPKDEVDEIDEIDEVLSPSEDQHIPMQNVLRQIREYEDPIKAKQKLANYRLKFEIINFDHKKLSKNPVIFPMTAIVFYKLFQDVILEDIIKKTVKKAKTIRRANIIFMVVSCITSILCAENKLVTGIFLGIYIGCSFNYLFLKI